MPDPLESGFASAAPNQPAKWPFLVFRIFAVANFIFAAIGLLLLAITIISISVGLIGNSPGQPYFLQAYWSMTVANLVFLALLIFGGIRLLQLKLAGVTICNAAFVAEILYFISTSLWSYPSTSVSMSIAAATGVGDMGVALQEISCYPILGLIFLNLARRRLSGPLPAQRSMRSTTPLSRLTATLMRILAVTTLLQVLINTRWMYRLVHGFWRIRRVWQSRYPQYPHLFHSLIFVNLAVAAVLVLIAVSLWKLNKKSLLVLSGVLVLEWIFIGVAGIISGIQVERYGLAGAMSLKSFLVGPNSMLVIWSQAHTRYLIIAPALIIATYLSRRFSRLPSAN